ncbi:hypothetical protein GF342_03435 [Candidatus Woesearchaeota archaeon]|nr:hypothetical protein [Candidatus Woesearchaeota archaeon]
MNKPVIFHRYKGKEQMNIISYSIVYKDIFSLDDFLALLHGWLVENEYASGDDYEFREDFYLQRESPRTGKQIQIRWRVHKVPSDTKKTKLYRYDFDIDIDVRGMQQVEFMHEGKKATADKGELEIQVTGNLVIDYEEAWKNHPWLKRYKKFIIHTWLKSQTKEQKGELDKEGKRLQDFIKEHLKMKDYGPGQLKYYNPTRPPR